MKKFAVPMMAAALILTSSAAFAADNTKPPVQLKTPGDRFNTADTNGDGYLTKDEMKAQQQKRLDEMFAKSDTDHDGKLSKDEMKASREAMKEHWKNRKEGTPGAVPPAGGQPK